MVLVMNIFLALEIVHFLSRSWSDIKKFFEGCKRLSWTHLVADIKGLFRSSTGFLCLHLAVSLSGLVTACMLISRLFSYKGGPDDTEDINAMNVPYHESHELFEYVNTLISVRRTWTHKSFRYSLLLGKINHWIPFNNADCRSPCGI